MPKLVEFKEFGIQGVRHPQFFCWRTWVPNSLNSRSSAAELSKVIRYFYSNLKNEVSSRKTNFYGNTHKITKFEKWDKLGLQNIMV